MTPESGASVPALARRLAGMSPRQRLLAAFVSGIVLATTQPPVGFWPLFFVIGPVMFWLWRGTDRKTAFRIGIACGTGFFAAALHWIVEPFLVDAAAHGWMAPFAVILLSVGLSLFWGIAFWAARTLATVLRAGGGVRAAVILGLCLSCGEFARSYVLTGFPWALPAYGWIDTPVAQTAAIFGPYALSLLTLVAALICGAAAGTWRAAPAIVTVIGVAGAWVWGEGRLDGATDPVSGPVIRILQTDVVQAEKWLPENVRPNFERLMAASTMPAATPPALVIWPESAVTFPIDMAPEARKVIRNRFRAELGGAELVTGSLRHNDGPDAKIGPGARWRNSLFLLSDTDDLAPPFDKNHLVPFGEYLPFDSFFSGIGISGLAGIGAGIVAGDRHVVMTPDRAPPFAPLICYEMIFPRETAAAAQGADWLILVTNDGWFGNWAGPAQHLAMARMRAIELGLPIARSANSGISGMIGPFGRLTASLNGAAEGIIDARLPDSLPPTTYRIYGETFATLAICLLLMFSTSGLPIGKNRPVSRQES